LDVDKRRGRDREVDDTTKVSRRIEAAELVGVRR
jgi:hypothetical protein